MTNQKPLRILQVVTTMNRGGIESFIMNLYRNIDRSRIQFDFLMHTKEETAFDHEILSMGGRIYKLNTLNPIRYFSYKKELIRFFKKHPEYKIIHSHINANSAIVLNAAKNSGIKVRIAHSHTIITTRKNWLFKEFLKLRVANLSTHRLACSKDAGNWLYGSKDFIVFKNSINSNRFIFDIEKRTEFRKKFKLKEDQTLIGHIGRINIEKNHGFLIRVFFEFLNLKKDSKLVLIGEGNLESKVKDLVKKLNIESHIIFTGIVSNPEDYLNAMDLFLFPSLFEGLGIALVEAQCNGLPVLMSDVIPKEVILTDLINQKSLSEHEGVWAEDLFSLENAYENNDRSKYVSIIKEKGYDVKENSEYLTSFYLNAVKDLNQ